MFVTPEQVQAATGYEVDGDLVFKAQFIIESFVGRSENEIFNAHDREVMGRAVTFQAAYMMNNYAPVYEQVAFIQKSQTDASIMLDTGLFAPYIAPLAALSLNRLTWYRSKSIKTGSFAGKTEPLAWEVN